MSSLFGGEKGKEHILLFSAVYYLKHGKIWDVIRLRFCLCRNHAHARMCLIEVISKKAPSCSEDASGNHASPIQWQKLPEGPPLPILSSLLVKTCLTRPAFCAPTFRDEVCVQLVGGDLLGLQKVSRWNNHFTCRKWSLWKVDSLALNSLKSFPPFPWSPPPTLRLLPPKKKSPGISQFRVGNSEQGGWHPNQRDSRGTETLQCFPLWGLLGTSLTVFRHQTKAFLLTKNFRLLQAVFISLLVAKYLFYEHPF